MNSPKPTLLSLLVAVGKIDSNLAHIAAEERKSRADIDQRTIKLNKVAEQLGRQDAEVKKRRITYQRDEKLLREENDKLTDRRNALANFPNYKLQQAAEREIDNTSRELSSREEALLGDLDQLEALEKSFKEGMTAALAEKAEIEEATREFNEMKTGFDERRRRQTEERQKLTAQIDPASLKLYDRVHEKYMMDPVIPLKGNTCSGCFMQVGPQVIVTLTKGDALVRCPGCGRIVYLAEGE